MTQNGTTAVNFEHSWGDGICVLRFINETYPDVMASTLPDVAVAPAAPQSLAFNVPTTVQSAIAAAGEGLDKVC